MMLQTRWLLRRLAAPHRTTYSRDGRNDSLQRLAIDMLWRNVRARQIVDLLNQLPDVTPGLLYISRIDRLVRHGFSVTSRRTGSDVSPCLRHNDKTLSLLPPPCQGHRRALLAVSGRRPPDGKSDGPAGSLVVGKR